MRSQKDRIYSEFCTRSEASAICSHLHLSAQKIDTTAAWPACGMQAWQWPPPSSRETETFFISIFKDTGSHTGTMTKLSTLVVAGLSLIFSPASNALSAPSRTISLADVLPAKMPSSSNPQASFAEAYLMDDPYSIATLLLGTLLEQRAADTDFSASGILLGLNSNFQAKRRVQERRIEEYITLLSDMPNNTYDPSKCLLGPLYCTLFCFNPSNPNQDPPLWEKISLKAENLKGQQYYMNPDYVLSVVNYAEIWGRQFAIRAQATFSPLSKEAEKKKTTKKDDWLASFFKDVLSGKFFAKEKEEEPRKMSLAANMDKSPDTALRSCPDRYDFRTFAAEFQFGENVVVPIPIEGTAQFAVLYADPRLRILLSPTGSQSVVGPWEQTGLVVVQVRSDLVTSDAAPLDLR